MSGRTTKIIGQVERGATNVRIDNLTSIAAGLNVNAGDLFRATSNDKTGERVLMVTERDLAQLEDSLRIVVRARRAGRRRERT